MPGMMARNSGREWHACPVLANQCITKRALPSTSFLLNQQEQGLIKGYLIVQHLLPLVRLVQGHVHISAAVKSLRGGDPSPISYPEAGWRQREKKAMTKRRIALAPTSHNSSSGTAIGDGCCCSHGFSTSALSGPTQPSTTT